MSRAVRLSRVVLLGGLTLALGLAGSLPAQAGAKSVVRSWVTDFSTGQRLSEQTPLRWRSGDVPDGTTVVVDPTRRYQKMTGFGASMTDSSAVVLSSLPTATRAKVMRQLFSPTQGIGLSVLRQPMGASDFSSVGNYSYDGQPSGQTDPDLSDFSIRHDRKTIIPRLHEAAALNPRLTLMASPWSPPGWMKTKGKMTAGGTLKEEYYGAYARYFVKFLRAYRQAGLPVRYVTAQNEPLYEPGSYPGMYFDADQATAFLGRHLGPAIERSGLDTQILGYDHNWDVTAYPEQLYKNRRSADYVPGTAWHCYGGDVSAQSVSHNSYPHAQAFLTECSGGTWQGTEQQAFAATMSSVIGVPRNWGQSVVLWNLALDDERGPQNNGCDTCRGVVTVHDDGTVSRELEFYGLGQASRFVRPGARRIASSQPATATTPGITDVAYTNPDGSGVLVAYNTATTAQKFSIVVGGKHVTTTLAAGAAGTYTWKGFRAVARVNAKALGWVDLDLGKGPKGTPTGRLVQSVGPEVLAGMDQVRVGDQWLAYSRPYGSTLTGPATSAVPRTGWTFTTSDDIPGEDASPISNLTDGDPETRWSSGTGQTDGMSLTLDLGRPTSLSQVVLDTGEASAGDYLRRYELQTSDDGDSWTAVATGAGRSGAMAIVLPQTQTRYLRIVSRASSGSWWSIGELTLRTASGSVAQVDRGKLRGDHGRLADGTKIIARYNAGHAPARVAFPVEGFDYAYRLPATAAVTFAVRNTVSMR